jgi:hypothetical protein
MNHRLAFIIRSRDHAPRTQSYDKVSNMERVKRKSVVRATVKLQHDTHRS